MKQVLFLLGLMLSTLVFAQGDPAARLKGLKQSTFSTGATISVPNNQVTKTSGIGVNLETGNKNLLANPSFEHQTFDTSWTIGSGNPHLETSIVIDGIKSARISNNTTFTQSSTLYASQIAGIQGVVSAWVKTGDIGEELCAFVDSVETDCVDISSDNKWREYVIPMILGSTSNGIRLKTNGGDTYIDDAYVGIMPANRMPEISQAQIAGEAYFAGTTNCAWSRTSTTIGAFGTDADCPSPTIAKQNIGSWQTTDADLPRITVNSLPAGEYKATFQISQFGGASDNGAVFAINDGTTTCYAQKTTVTTVATAATISCVFTYTSSGNRSFEVYAASASSSVTLNSNSTSPAGSGLKFILEYYPPKSKVYSGSTIYPHAQFWGSVNYDTSTNCVWSITGTTFTNFTADADCSNPTATGKINAPSTKIPAFVLPSGSPAGTYEIRTKGYYYSNPSTDAICYYRLSDGTNATEYGPTGNTGATGGYTDSVTGKITYSSSLTSDTTIQLQAREVTGNTSSCEIYASVLNARLTFEVYYFPPQDNPIIGTFAGIEKCEDDFECTDTFSAKVSSAGVVSAENLDWINGNASLTNTSEYAITFNSGIFTVTPNCQVTLDNSSTALSHRIFTSSSSGFSYVSYVTATGSNTASGSVITCQKQGSDYKPKTAKAATTNEMMYVPNVTRPKTCYYAFGGASATLASPTVCAASPCVEVYDSCSAGTAPTRSGAGVYDDLTFANGTWKASSFLDCRYQSFSTSAGSDSLAIPIFRTSDNTWSTNANGGAVLNLRTLTVFTSPSDGYVQIACTADAP